MRIQQKNINKTYRWLNNFSINNNIKPLGYLDRSKCEYNLDEVIKQDLKAEQHAKYHKNDHNYSPLKKRL